MCVCCSEEQVIVEHVHTSAALISLTGMIILTHATFLALSCKYEINSECLLQVAPGGLAVGTELWDNYWQCAVSLRLIAVVIWHHRHEWAEQSISSVPWGHLAVWSFAPIGWPRVSGWHFVLTFCSALWPVALRHITAILLLTSERNTYWVCVWDRWMAAMFDGFHPLSLKPGHFWFDSFNLFVLKWDFKNSLVAFSKTCQHLSSCIIHRLCLKVI